MNSPIEAAKRATALGGIEAKLEADHDFPEADATPPALDEQGRLLNETRVPNFERLGIELALRKAKDSK